MPEITLVLGVDAKTLPQFEVSHRTWKLHQPKIWSWPWVVFYDGNVETMPDILLQSQGRGAFPEHAKFACWPGCVSGDNAVPKYENQREKMLSGFPYVAAQYVHTQWWAKIDCDAICHRREECWAEDRWFTDYYGPQPIAVAPGWGYTKGINFIGRLQEWGDKTGLKKYPRLDIPFDPTHLRVPHKRWCSWNSFYETAWTKTFVEFLGESVERGTLPIPSQDSTMWYAAERAGLTVRLVNMKRHGWNNYPKLDKLIEAAQSVMRGDAQEAMSDG